MDHLYNIYNEFTNIHLIPLNILYRQLLEINKKLHFNSYLLLLKDMTKNYLICHIPLEDIKIFGTQKDVLKY